MTCVKEKGVELALIWGRVRLPHLALQEEFPRTDISNSPIPHFLQAFKSN
jgi:hypothetical protein